MVDVTRGNYRPGKQGCGESGLYGKRALGKTTRVGSVTWGKIAQGKQACGKCLRGSELAPIEET